MPRWILIFFLLFFFVCQNLSANIKINIKIEGLKEESLTDNVLAYLNEESLKKNIFAFLSLEQQKNHPNLSTRRIQRLHHQAPEEIKNALKPFGYYKVQIQAELKSPKPKETEWSAHYLIQLGEPLKIDHIEINILGEAKADEIFQKQLANLPIKKGDILNHPHYEKAKRILRTLAEERGYFDAQFTQHEIRINEQAYTANIVLSIDTKERYRFGIVTFHQKDFKESLLQRYLTFQPGDFYTATALLAFKNALTNSGYFDNVDVDMKPALANENLQMPIGVTLETRKANKYAFGIGYGTDTGIRGSFEWKRRYVNRHGHHFSIKTELSEIRQGVTTRYYIPYGQKIDNFFTIIAGYKDEQTDTSESEVLLLGLNKNHSRMLFNTQISEVIGIEYRDERYTVGSDSGHAKLLMPHINWSYVTADNRVYTRRGHKLQLGLQGALNHIGSNVSFLQTRLDGTFIRQVLKKGRIIARGNLGYSVISLLDSDFYDIPPSIRFFAGGDRSVRGYDYQALGPKNTQGQVIGGKNLLVGSLEYEHHIFNKWSLATFYDIGNAFNDFSEPLKQGAGLGVRWQSPVGLIRVDVAAALEKGYPLRLHITVGPDL